MSISAMMGSSLSGMHAAAKGAHATANNVANTATPGYDRLATRSTSLFGGGVSASASPSGALTPAETSNVDMASEMLDLMSAETSFKANAAVFETGAELWDILKLVVKD
jgi:flagellar hook protein FlgE